MKKLLFIIFILIVFDAKADLLKEFIKNPKGFNLKANIDEDCVGCAAMTERRSRCPSFVGYFTNEVMKRSIYSTVVGNKITSTCLPKSVKLGAIENSVNDILKKHYNSPVKVRMEDIDKCLVQNRIEGDRGENRKLIAAYLYGLDSSITKLQAEKIKEIALTDQFLNKPILNGIYCDDHKSLCNKLKACKPKVNALNTTVDYSITSLAEILKLEKQKNEVNQKLIFANVTGVTPTIANEIKKDIDKKIKFIMTMNPWFKGDIVNKEIDKVKAALKKNNKTEASNILKSSLVKQVEDARNIQKKTLVDLNLSQNCVQTNTSCNAGMFKKMNKYYTYHDSTMIKNDKAGKGAILEANQLKDSANCMANLKSDKESMDELNLMLGRTVATLGVGAVGGVVKLGSMALKFYESGNAIKGVASATALVGMGTMANDAFRDVKESCRESISRMEKAKKTSDFNSCGDDAKNIYRLSDLKSCITDIALTTIPSAIVAGGALKSLKASKDAKALKNLNNTGNYSQNAIISKITNPYFSDAEKAKIASSIDRFDLTKGQLDDILSKVNKTVKTKKEKDNMQEYFNFVTSLKPNEQISALKQLEDIALLSGKVNPGGYVAQFQQKERKFKVYETFKQKTIESQLKKRGLKPEDAKLKSTEMASSSRKAMQDRFYACRSTTVTPEHKKASSRFIGLSLALGIGGVTNGNYRANKDTFEKDKLEWFGKLSYDIAMVMVISKINQRLVKTNQDSVVKKYFQSNVRHGVIGSLDAVVYSRIYGVSEKEAERKIEEIKNSPDNMKELAALEKYIDKTNMAEKFEIQIVSDFKNVLKSKEKNTLLGKPPYLIGGNQFESLSEKDLDNPVIRQKIVNGLVKEMNTGAGNPLISTGDLGADRWVYDRMWGAAVGVPKGIVTSMIMYQILCLGADRPFASLGVASGVQFINQFFSGAAYYQYRKEAIGQ